ncbi:MAG: SpoIIE family protein phosphatase [Armatimonadota bacterium]
MAKGYLHVEIDTLQLSKHEGDVCGDVIMWERTESSTNLVISDGMGHGIKANIAAEMCAARLMELIRQGTSLRQAFSSLVHTMEQAKTSELPYAVFTVVRILNDGVSTVLSYEMPAPIFLARRYAQVLQQRTFSVGHSLIGEATCHLTKGEGIMVMSDGVTMAGLDSGQPGMVMGWGVEGVNQFSSDQMSSGVAFHDLPEHVMSRTVKLWGTSLGDDCSILLAGCRPGNTVNIFTGPPTDPEKDMEVVNRFMMLQGTKVVCGGITAQITAENLGVPIEMEEKPKSLLSPPRCYIDGIDLVSEGAITLNQIYNVLDEEPGALEDDSAVTELHELLKNADRVRIMMGGAINPATRDISFRQKGILTRQAIVPLLARKLQEAGKLVIVEDI